MKNTCISRKPGDIVQLAGIDFVVLEDRSPFSGEGESHDLFILALEGQGESRFGDTNNYAESELKSRVDDWLYRLTEKMTEQWLDSDLIRTRTISLTTLDGYKGYSDLEVKAAPLTLDEARRCAESMPAPGIRMARYAPKVVSPRPVRPERFRAFTGQVNKSFPS